MTTTIYQHFDTRGTSLHISVRESIDGKILELSENPGGTGGASSMFFLTAAQLVEIRDAITAYLAPAVESIPETDPPDTPKATCDECGGAPHGPHPTAAFVQSDDDVAF